MQEHARRLSEAQGCYQYRKPTRNPQADKGSGSFVWTYAKVRRDV